MLKIDSIHSFYSSWNPQLDPKRGGIILSTVRKIKKILFFLPDCIVATCINPRKATKFHPYSYDLGGYHEFSKEIITSDQVHLSASVNILKGANKKTPVVILFNPLGANSSIHSELKLELLSRNCNVITFDYRGLGNTRAPEDLINDGEGVYQYVTSELGTDKKNVHFFGFSLGAVIAAQVKALHPESKGKYVGDRPFKSIFSLITETVCISSFDQITKIITSLVSAIFLAFPINLLGWEWDGVKALEKMKGDVRIVYHPKDYLIPYKASLASQCISKQVIRLSSIKDGPSTHFSPLSKHFINGKSAAEVVADFFSN